VAVLLVAAGCSDDHQAEPSATSTPPAPASPSTTTPAVAAGLFAEATGHVLVLDDGYDGVVVIDPDHRTATRRVVQGQRAGDQDPRLHRAGDALIVGWDGVWAAPIDGGPRRRLGRATVAIPAADPDQVWLSWYPGRRIGAGGPTYALVDVATGDDLVVRRGPPDPATLGVPGGLALQSPRGIEIWDAERDRVVRRLGHEPAFPNAVSGSLLAWCDGPCTDLHLTDLTSGEDRLLDHPDGSPAWNGYSGAFSPDGRQLATWAGSEAVLVDVETGAVEVVGRGRQPYGSVAWSPDGSALYWSTPRGLGSQVGRVDPATGEVETVDVDVRSGDLVVLDAADAQGLLVDPTGPAEDCPAPRVQPSGRGAPCAFRL
jgi:hypothetical protein